MDVDECWLEIEAGKETDTTTTEQSEQRSLLCIRSKACCTFWGALNIPVSADD
jgi:hypothetical protein